MATWIMGEFSSTDTLLKAARTLRDERAPDVKLDAHTPYPVHGLEEALGLSRSIVPKLAACGALTGVTLGYVMQWYLNGINYPLLVAGKPPHSPPLFVPVTFELGILLTAFSIFFGLFVLWGFPRPHHPVFEVPAFKSASTHAFWLSALVPDDAVSAWTDRLQTLGASNVAAVKES